MFAVDDGIWSGNLNAADVFFLIASILALVAAVLAFPRRGADAAPVSAYSPFIGWLAIACVAFAFLIL